MIWHGIYKQLVQVFIENISNQLFFAIFVNAEKICSVWKSCLNIFQQLFFGFLPQLNTTIPGRRIVPSIFRYIILEESARPTGSSTVLEKIFHQWKSGYNQLHDSDCIVHKFFFQESGCPGYGKYVRMPIHPDFLLQDDSGSCLHHPNITHHIPNHKNIPICIIYCNVFCLCRIDDFTSNHMLDFIDGLILFRICHTLFQKTVLDFLTDADGAAEILILFNLTYHIQIDHG